MLRRFFYLFVLFSAFLLAAPRLYAQRMLTLEEAIATALQNNYDIQLSRNDSAVTLEFFSNLGKPMHHLLVN
jgi:hypothetical protein